jgi:hypothetical protein
VTTFRPSDLSKEREPRAGARLTSNISQDPAGAIQQPRTRDLFMRILPAWMPGHAGARLAFMTPEGILIADFGRLPGGFEAYFYAGPSDTQPVYTHLFSTADVEAFRREAAIALDVTKGERASAKVLDVASGEDDDLERLRQANSLVPEGTIDLETSTAFVIDTDALLGAKEELVNLVLAVGQTTGKNVRVAFIGQKAEAGPQLARLLGIKSPGRFQSGTENLENLPVSVLTSTRNLPVLKQQFQKARFAVLAPPPDDGLVGVYAFAPVSRYMNLLVRGSLDAARQFYNRMNGYDLSEVEHDALSKGDPELARRFAIRPVLRRLLDEARRLYILTRSYLTAA